MNKSLIPALAIAALGGCATVKSPLENLGAAYTGMQADGITAVECADRRFGLSHAKNRAAMRARGRIAEAVCGSGVEARMEGTYPVYSNGEKEVCARITPDPGSVRCSGSAGGSIIQPIPQQGGDDLEKTEKDMGRLMKEMDEELRKK